MHVIYKALSVFKVLSAIQQVLKTKTILVMKMENVIVDVISKETNVIYAMQNSGDTHIVMVITLKIRINGENEP